VPDAGGGNVADDQAAGRAVGVLPEPARGDPAHVPAAREHAELQHRHADQDVGGRFAMGDKTEEASPHRMQEAREKGKSAKASDLTSAVLMIVGFSTLMSQTTTLGHAIRDLGREMFLSVERLSRVDLTAPIVLDLVTRCINLVLLLAAPIMGAVLVVGLLTNF